MELVFRAPSVNDVNIVKSILENNDIPCALRNDLLQSTANEMSTEMWPEVWIINDMDIERAIELIETRNKPSNAPDWTCPSCGEKIEGEFDACWKCGTFRATATDSVSQDGEI